MPKRQQDWSDDDDPIISDEENISFNCGSPLPQSSASRRSCTNRIQVSLVIQMGAVKSFDVMTCYGHDSTPLILTLCIFDANFAKF